MNTIFRKCSTRRGIALVMCLVFLVVFSALSLSLFTTSNTNLQAASNHVQANRARMAAESGLEFVKSWMSRVHLPGSTPPQYRYAYLRHYLATDMLTQGVSDVLENTQLWIGYQYGGIVVNSDGDRFYAVLENAGQPKARIVITGIAGSLQRILAAEFTYGSRKDSVFNYGMATKGPLILDGSVSILGASMAVEADVYIESDTTANALSISGNSQIAGDVKITNPNAIVTLTGAQAGIGGETGLAAITNHVVTGAARTQFPYPNSSSFAQYATGEVITASTDLTFSRTLTNARIAAGTNPTFNNVTIMGVLYIESPNVVTFEGSTNVTGLIVANGSQTDNSEVNKISFAGNVISQSASELPAELQFDGLRTQTGTFLLAPGFSLTFGGNFGTLNGAIAGNGVTFYGNAGGTIAGSIINYSNKLMNISTRNDLIFNRSGCTDIPAGFLSEIMMYFDPVSYSEPAVSH